MNDLAQAIENLGAELRAALAIPREDQLWTLSEIAQFAKYGRQYTENEIVTIDDFPAPIRVTGPNAKPRWVAGEVIEWFKRKR